LQTRTHLNFYIKMAPVRYIYLDNAAATGVDSRVVEAMHPYWGTLFGNPDSLHGMGVQAQQALNAARERVAHTIGAHADEIVFTSGGTESNNLAIQGVVQAQLQQGTAIEDIHIVATTVEHSSVRACLQALEVRGVKVSFVPVDTEGFVDVQALAALVTRHTVLVSVVYVHNEIGTIARMRDIARVLRKKRAEYGTSLYLHTDASQAPAWVSCQVASLGVDMMTLASQKVYGPKGAGCLYRMRGVLCAPILYGGAQEFGMRPGTPALANIVGFATALQYVEQERATYIDRVRMMRDQCIHAVQQAIPDVVLNGPMGNERSAHLINMSFPGLDGEQIVLELDARGVATSTRSACLTSSDPGSYVVAALGKSVHHARGTLRLSLARDTTEEDMAYATQMLIDVVQWLKR
jgi:cysteine desulfurase